MVYRLRSNPPLIVADDPTGNLDFESGQHLVVTLADLAERGHAIVMVTHDLEHLYLAKQVVRLWDGIGTGFYPARGATKVSALDALRYE